jgi:hypothetical protein
VEKNHVSDMILIAWKCNRRLGTSTKALSLVVTLSSEATCRATVSAGGPMLCPCLSMVPACPALDGR